MSNKDNSDSWHKYKNLRNQQNYLIRKSYSKYIQELAQNCTTNPKRFWNLVSNSRKRPQTNSFHIQDKTVNDPVLIAEEFNSNFQKNISEATKSLCLQCSHDDCDSRLYYLQTSSVEAKKILAGLVGHKTSGPDNVSAMLKLLLKVWHTPCVRSLTQ